MNIEKGNEYTKIIRLCMYIWRRNWKGENKRKWWNHDINRITSFQYEKQEISTFKTIRYAGFDF